jgi:hypothetical protein
MSRSRISLAVTLLALLALGLWVWRPVREMLAIAALKEAMEHGSVDAWPRRDGDSIDRLLFDDTSWFTRLGRQAFGARPWDYWYETRLRFFVQGPIEEVTFMGGRVNGDVRAALARLPKLRKLEICTTATSFSWPPENQVMTERDLDILRDAARSLPRLEGVVIMGGAAPDVVPPISTLPSPAPAISP